MKSVILITSAVLFAYRIQAADLPESLFGGVVTFKLPRQWEVQKHFTNQSSAEVLQILIPDPDTDNTPDSSNVGITAEKRQPGATLDDYKTRYAGRADRGFLTIKEISAGKSWLSMLSHGMQGKTHYTVIDRLGLDSDCFVTFRAACPLIERKDKDWMGRFAADCNAVIKSLKIRGKTIITSELKLDIVDHNAVLWLRDLRDPAKHF